MNETLDLNAIIDYARQRADYDRNVAPTADLRKHPQEIYDMVEKFKDRDITGITMRDSKITALFTQDKVNNDE